MVSAKTLGAVQLIGGLLALWLGWGDWAVVVLAVVFLVMAAHHFMEK